VALTETMLATKQSVVAATARAKRMIPKKKQSVCSDDSSNKGYNLLLATMDGGAVGGNI